MSKYTTELRVLLENNFDIGLKNYPIFDESYREILNQKIIGHYYFREIGMETAALFRHYLNQTMEEIMPYYNQLYKSELLEFNPFYNTDKTITSNSDNSRFSDFNSNATAKNTQSGTSENTATDTGNTISSTAGNSLNENVESLKGKKVFSDTPQGMLNVNTIENETYATTAEFNVNENKATSSNSEDSITNTSNTAENVSKGSISNSGETESTTANTTTSNDFENYVSHVVGKSEGESYSELLLRFRDTFLNIDMLIIDELKTCFMMIY